MKKLLALLLLLPCLAFGRGKESYRDIRDFHCGLDSYHSSLNIGDCFVQQALNVYFDKEAGVTKRKGFTVFGSSQAYNFNGAWSYTDASNNAWMIVRASDTIMATSGSGTFSVKIATVASADTVNSANAFGSIYFVDPTQGVYFWNGTSTTYVSGSPKGSLIASFHGRLWVSGQAVPNGNLLNGSKYLDGSTWATGSLATDPVQFTVGLNDNYDNVSALFSGFNDTLYVFKNYSILGLFGFDQTDFQTRVLNTEVGCIDQGSIQPIYGELIFMSQRGLEAYDGYTSQRISAPIKNLVDPATSNNFNQRSWIQQTESDWELGTQTPSGSLDTVTAPGSVFPKTQVFVDSTDANFSAGTFSQTVETSSAVFLSTGTVSAAIANSGFDTGTSSWTYAGSWQRNASTTHLSGNNCVLNVNNGAGWSSVSSTALGNNLLAEIIDANSGVTLKSVTVNYVANSCGYTTRSIDESGIARRLVKVRYTLQGNVLLSDPFLANSDFLAFATASDASGASGEAFALDPGGSTGADIFYTGTFTSRIFNTGVSSPSVIVSSFGYTQADFVPTFDLQTSPDQITWTDLGTSTTTAYLAKQYLRYLSTFTVTNTGISGPTQNGASSLNYVSIMYATATLTTQAKNISGISKFGALTVTQDLTTGGAVAYAVCTSSMSTMIPKTCAAQTVNAQVSVGTNTYVQVVATFTVTASTQVPTLKFLQLNWTEGTKRPRMTSAVYDNRYWLGFTTSTADTANEAVIVMAKGPVFSLFDLHAGAFVSYRNSLYHVDADATGNVYLDDTGYNDNGKAINAYIKTKDYGMSSDGPDSFITDKYFDSFYILAENLGNYNIYTNYYLDGASTAYALGTAGQNELTGRLTAKLPIPLDATHQNFGRTIAFQFQQNDVDAPMKLYGGVLVYKTRPVQ